MKLQIDLDPRYAAGILAGLVQANRMQIRDSGLAGRFPVLEGLRAGTIRYREADAQERWKTWQQTLQDGWGDCDDLAPAIAAEYLEAGIFARPVAYPPMASKGDWSVWHVVVEVWSKGGKAWLGDPSRLGGMNAAA